jgi:uncharacterized protein YwgA
MNAKRIADRLTSIQRVALLLASVSKATPIRGKLWFQKQVFAISKNLPKLSENLEYEPALMGPFSEALEVNVDQLVAVELLEQDGARYELTPTGREVASIIEKETKPEELQLISDVKELMNDLTDDELLALVYYTNKDMISESEKVDKIAPKRKDLSASLFRKGKIGAEMGALIAGLDVQDYLDFLRSKGIRVFSE